MYSLNRGGVEDTRLKAKDIKKILRPRPSTDPLKAKDRGHKRRCSPKKKVSKNIFQAISKKGLQNFFSGKKGLEKIFFRRSPLEETKKRSTQIFLEVSGVFQQNFNGLKISGVLEPRTGQFSRT